MEYESLMKLLKKRRSIRKFKNTEIPQGDIEKLLAAAVTAPSAGNKQNWQFIVVKNGDMKNQLKKVVEKKIDSITSEITSAKAKKEFIAYTRYYTFFNSAPVVICIVVKPYDSITRRILKLYNIKSDYVSTANVQGPAAAIENLLLAAVSLGYGACWMTGPLLAKKDLERVLGIDAPDELMAIVPIGIPDENPPQRSRKKLEEVVKIIE